MGGVITSLTALRRLHTMVKFLCVAAGGVVIIGAICHVAGFACGLEMLADVQPEGGWVEVITFLHQLLKLRN